ncbi:MAG: UvrD-helicase domain-containing protein [bacterium]|nr:UvrD-helicase domain-containing protein [bacterium]
MSRIEIISASAGSGKTFRLAQTLEAAIVQGQARPEAILATTFTRDAATELSSRVRQRLLASQMPAEAQQLEAAWIGTVNSVCARIVETAAFELGLSPQLETMDEAVANSTFRTVLSRLLTSERQGRLDALARRMPDFRWAEEMRRIVDFARANNMDASALREQGARSIASAEQLFQPWVSQEGVVARTLEALAQFIEQAPSRGDTTKATRSALEEAGRARADLLRGASLSWNVWCSLSKLKPGAKCKDLGADVRAAAIEHGRSGALWEDVEAAIEECYALAADAMALYDQHKRSFGVLDFTDQEVFALEALKLDPVRERLAGTIDLVLVDEFQDTSPLQLAIFNALAGLAKRSVWVGDQKQAIYGFRGTDPELMDAAIGSILGEHEPETLERSWRSRGALVEATSDAFAAAFEPLGVPPSRVRLQAAETRDADALGPVLEAWPAETKNKQGDADALADGVRQLLDDPSVHVRDRLGPSKGTLAIRRARASDVAVLCRTHKTCQEVAVALEEVGVSVALPRTGLLRTVEGRACLVALRLFCSPGDALARAELARLAWTTDPQGWLEALLDAEPGRAFSDDPLVRTVEDLAGAHPEAGGVTALDLVMDAIGVDELCRGWGDAQARLDNLDALRAHAVVFRDTALSSGTATSPAALVLALEALEREGLDARAVPRGTNSVEISTWHAAKGREWPITVLAELTDRPSSSLGVRAFSSSDGFDGGDPLAHRVVRYWPNPYDARNNGMPFHDALAAHPEALAADRRARFEGLRLLYVGWTRARDRLIVAGRRKTLEGAGTLGLLEGSAFDLDAKVFRTPAGESPMVVRVTVPRELEGRGGERGPELGPPLREPVVHAPARISPSELEAEGRVVETVRLGGPLRAGEGLGTAAFGSAVHTFLAADRGDFDEPRRFQLAADILQRWEVADTPPVSLLEASDRLQGWLRQRWTAATLHREVPLSMVRGTGTLLSGIADLLVETPQGWVVVDHKTHVGSQAELEAYAVGVAGQLGAYAEVLAAMGRPVVVCMVHFPLSGGAVLVG